MLPVGIGAVVGGVGNRMMGKKIVANARRRLRQPAGAVAVAAAPAARAAPLITDTAGRPLTDATAPFGSSCLRPQ